MWAAQRREHEGGLEFQPGVERLGEAEQFFVRDQVDLVEHQHARIAHVPEAIEQRLDLGGHAALDVDDQRHDVGIAGAGPGSLDHGAIEPALRREDARGVDEHDLRLALGDDAADLGAGGLRLVGDDRHLGADQGVEQRRLAGVGRADQGDEAAAGVGGGLWRVVHDVAPCQTFSRTRKASAALCSASFLLGPVAVSGSKPSSRTAMVNSGAWSGPVRSTS